MNIVKESIKNIVPTWLQRYFTQNEETSPNEQRNLEGDINYHPAFADDITENALEIDGRITPEPTRITLGGGFVYFINQLISLINNNCRFSPNIMNYDKDFANFSYYTLLFYIIASIFILLTNAFQDDHIKFNGRSNLI